MINNGTADSFLILLRNFCTEKSTHFTENIQDNKMTVWKVFTIWPEDLVFPLSIQNYATDLV